MMLRIANAQGFWGDRAGAAAQLLDQCPELDFLTLDYLAEVSLSILAKQKERDSSKGYAQDFLEVVESLIPFWTNGSKVKIVTNAGGLNPVECAQACHRLLQWEGCGHLRVALVEGDDVLADLVRQPAAEHFANLDSGLSLERVSGRLVNGNAYIGASMAAEALRAGADIVIAGRMADPSMVVAPCLAHFGWKEDDHGRIAQATVAGHLIECGSQATGGFSTDWMEISEAEHLAFPIVEIEESGSFVITKPANSGGRVSLLEVKEQLLYEIGDPSHYLSPDVTVDFSTLQLTEEGKDRVRVEGASGSAPTSYYKVNATYRDGYKAHGMLTIFGERAAEKAQRCGEIVLQRVAEAGHVVDRSAIELLGTGACVSGVLPEAESEARRRALEVVLRISVAAATREPVACFAREMVPLVTGGPQGVTGYAGGRPKVQPVFGFWPCTIPRDDLSLRWRMWK